MIIKILGSGCKKCVTLTENTRTALANLGREAEVIKVTEISEMIEAEVIKPALLLERRHGLGQFAALARQQVGEALLEIRVRLILALRHTRRSGKAGDEVGGGIVRVPLDRQLHGRKARAERGERYILVAALRRQGNLSDQRQLIREALGELPARLAVALADA